MILCKHCGHPVETIEANCFNHGGSDSWGLYDVVEVEKGVAQMDLPASWCGDGLTDSEKMESIICSNCGRFPFSETAGVNTQAVITVVCFEED